MPEVISMVSQLQMEAVNKNVPVSNLLRLSKVIATKLTQKEALSWIDQELNGYRNIKAEEIPQYRHLRGTPKAYNPYHGWIPIDFENIEQAKILSTAVINQSLGSIEESLTNGKKQLLTMPYPIETKKKLSEAVLGLDVQLLLDYSQLCGIIEAVRNLILEWGLQFEKAGIYGENMSFTAQEKQEASIMTQQYFIQHVGVIGNVTDQAQVNNKQNVYSDADLSQLKEFIIQCKNSLKLVPKEISEKLKPLLKEIESKKNSEDHSKIRSILYSIKEICEGVVSNIITEGILATIKNFLR